MKKILLLFVILLSVLNLSAQEKYSEYEMSYFSEHMMFDAEISIDKPSMVWLSCMSLESENDNCGILIRDTSDFINFLKSIDKKYIEWVKVAKENNVSELRKDFDFKERIYCAYWVRSELWIDLNVKLTSEFMVKDGKYIVIIRTGKLNSSSNQYIDHDGLVIVLSNEEEFDTLINCFDSKLINDFINQKNEKENLFE